MGGGSRLEVGRASADYSLVARFIASRKKRVQKTDEAPLRTTLPAKSCAAGLETQFARGSPWCERSRPQPRRPQEKRRIRKLLGEERFAGRVVAGPAEVPAAAPAQIAAAGRWDTDSEASLSFNLNSFLYPSGSGPRNAERGLRRQGLRLRPPL